MLACVYNTCRGADPGGAGGASAPPGMKGVVHSLPFALPGNREAPLHELRNLEINFAKKINLKYFSQILSQLKTESILKQDSSKDSDTASDDLSVSQILKVIGSSCLRKMIPQVCQLGSLYSVSPASTVTCERSFSHLRQVKSYMRAAMGQKRLNHSCIGLLNVYNEELDSLNRTDIVNDFIFANEQRRKIFAIVQK